MNDERTVPIMRIKGNAIAVCLYMILLATGVLVHLYGQQTNAGANAAVVIPNDAIRLRILANSDAAQDQELKRKVRDAVNAQINGWVAELTSLAEAKRVIRSHLPDIEQTVARVLRDERSHQLYKVEFRPVRFPTKVYGDYVYPAGTYEAVLITLGEGKGANWWCVLFPPLCFLDFSNGDAVMMMASQTPNHGPGQPNGEDETVREEKVEPRGRETVSSTKEAAGGASQAGLNGDAGSVQTDDGEERKSSLAVTEAEQPVEVRFFFKEWFDRLVP
ncbi:stage II sporulation protein R [Geobacillus icigianus]